MYIAIEVQQSIESAEIERLATRVLQQDVSVLLHGQESSPAADGAGDWTRETHD